MLFNSLEFAIFLPIVFVLYWALPHRFRWVILFIASYYFYMSWNAAYVVLILFTTIASYTAALLVEKAKTQKAKKWILACTLIICLGILVVFKYFNFFFDAITQAFRLFAIDMHPITLQLLLPVGISFYTFQTLSYTIDVYRGTVKAERHFGIYATFISFFPQLVAGPIERTENLLPQIREKHTFNYDQATYGLKMMAWGFFKKMIIADNLAVYVDKVYDNVYQYHGFALILATIFFAIQIYCDFSGYSDIARGTAKLFGIDLMDNFKSPYFATSIKEFWSRWHISLSTWFRDYVYIPLGGNRTKKWRHYCNLLITFLVSGLWHGANWTYLAWGAVHGVTQVAETALKIKPCKKKFGLVWAVRVGIVFAIVVFAWVFFRAQSLPEALHVFTHMFSGISHPLSYIRNGFRAGNVGIGLNEWELLKCVLLYFLPLFVFDYFNAKKDVIQWISNRKVGIRWAIYIGIVFLVLMYKPITSGAEFIYFQF